METFDVNRRATCPLCYGPLDRKLEGEVGQRVEWKVCRFCGAEFGPPWPEHQWTEPSSEREVSEMRPVTLVRIHEMQQDFNDREMGRVRWNEERFGVGLFLIIAEWNGTEWKFWERDGWEARWYPMHSNCTRIAKAEELAKDMHITPKKAA